MNLLIFILVCVSITSIIQNETITAPVRRLIKKISTKLYNFVSCPTCLGFWVGFIVSYFLTLNEDIYLNMIICSLISSLMNKLYFSSGFNGFSEE